MFDPNSLQQNHIIIDPRSHSGKAKTYGMEDFALHMVVLEDNHLMWLKQLIVNDFP